MKKWLNLFLQEKGINTDYVMEVEGESGINYIPVCALVEMILNASKAEQSGIKKMLIKIDFFNGNVMDYFRHLAQAVAV